MSQLPPVVDGDQGTVTASSSVTRQTKPPAYFTLASLLDAMVNIDLYIDDPRAKIFLGGPSADQKRGIGTGATRASIIKTVFDRGYVEERGTAIHTTPRGSAFVGLARRLVPWMVNPIHSVEQEAALQDIEAGRGDHAAYVADVLNRTQQTLVRLRESGDTTRIEDSTAAPAGTPSGSTASQAGSSGLRSGAGSPTARKTYFVVPFDRKDEAKAAGLRWDAEARKWFAPTAEIAKAAKAFEREGGKRAPSGSTKAPIAGTAAPPPAPSAVAGRVYFRVPFDRKDEAKAMGMRFDGDRKQWFAPSAEIVQAAMAVFPAPTN